ncbi:trifunctional transcriptional regulator/proline dehydrogenase/L-glutamate gamma-semialdehyde dehydrogenase [Lichenicoccus sp.]|uniref:trifunctional transcriptional regulator/proline dehydrogenase/L-glutamate gamma-semialdehyde dehydrogenase n=1 Tax=Lichenicoccus sp. TaxID=2781899 RepID=UPI003D0AECA6
MPSTTIGVKLDDLLRGRLREAAQAQGRTPHWFVKQAILTAIEQAEGGGAIAVDAPPAAPDPDPAVRPPQPFLEFAQGVQPQSVLRARITAACRIPEEEAVPMLLPAATLPSAQAEAADALARALVTALRQKSARGGVEGLIKEYDLSSQEGIALMCLAEALLRIPDRATRDALIRDKISTGNWQAHLGRSPSLFVNAATWGLVVTGRLTATSSELGLSSALTRLIGRGGEPVIRRGVDMAMRMMGEQFVTGQTIAEALANSRRLEKQGFRHSYDMLGEAAMTAEDAQHYTADYERAIHAIGRASARRGIYEGAGISIKLSALHPRYSRSQRDRVMDELLPRLRALALLSRSYDIGMNIDAEESDRLELSLDLLEALCLDPELAGWNGIGFVVQAYQKRAPFVIDWIIALGRATRRRIMLRLVKGAYWDSEIKRAQQDGLEGYPVFTRKAHTDISYIACARRLLAAPDAVFPQFATHNARTLASIHAMAGAGFYVGQYEFQCLHGMGEPLYEEVVGHDKLNRPCRIYAPVGTHETLLAYLVRRLLENGANTSFVNRIGDAEVPVEELVADPAVRVAAGDPVGSPEPRIALPRALFGPERLNAEGLDLNSEQRLASLSASLLASSGGPWTAVAPGLDAQACDTLVITSPAQRQDRIGLLHATPDSAIPALVGRAAAGAELWRTTPPEERAAILCRAAVMLEGAMQPLAGLIVREAGKILADAVGEVREAVDFLRYYAAEVRCCFDNETHRPLGVVACISPWNFPLAIFIGQVAAALAAGNAVLAKPAEETPLIAAQAVALLHEAGIPAPALQLVPGAGEVGAALVAHADVRGVMFTGSLDVAAAIQLGIAGRLSPNGQLVPLIAETGGQNAMIVDSSALTEQVVADVLLSAFNSAGQRCSALRLLCLQEDVADRTLRMLRGAMAELCIGNPDRLQTDVGPVISDAARELLLAHVARMRAAGHAVHELVLDAACAHGSFVAPTLIEIDDVADIEREVFGPVLHVLRYARNDLDALLEDIAATGYALTFGVHTRLDETIAHIAARAPAGNIYVNRNIVGAVVGVQPFGGHGLSGTGPKAGGPLLLRRLLAHAPAATTLPAGQPTDAAIRYAEHLAAAVAECPGCGLEAGTAATVRSIATRSPLGAELVLPGPVGERNVYALRPRGVVLCVAETLQGAAVQLACVLATGNRPLIDRPERFAVLLERLPADLLGQDGPGLDAAPFAAALFEGDGDELAEFSIRMAHRHGPLVTIFAFSSREIRSGRIYPLEFLLTEQCVSVNTAAAGGNASLMSIG